MISLFDCNFLSILFNERARIPRRADGKLVVENAQERIDLLVKDISKERSKIILPTPALAEFMLLAQSEWTRYLTLIRRNSIFEIAGFDEAEAAELVQLCLLEGKVKAKGPGAETWAKVKYDRQIVAIAKTKRVEVVYSTDGGVRKLAEKMGIAAKDLVDLKAPGPRQTELFENASDSKIVEFPVASAGSTQE